MRAGSAIGDAAQDPTLANVTNAGVQTAFTALRPLAAAKILGAGYAGAAAQQSGLFDTSAEAQSKKGGAPKVVLPGLTQEQQSFYDAAEKRLREDDFGSPADRRQVQQQMQDLRTLSNDFVRENAASERRLREKSQGDKQAEYDRGGGGLGSRLQGGDVPQQAVRPNARWRDVREDGRLCAVPCRHRSGRAVPRWRWPQQPDDQVRRADRAGAVAGAFAPNAPSYYNSTHTPPDNPKKRAYEARAEALPPEHPRRQEFFDYAAVAAGGEPCPRGSAEGHDAGEHPGAIRDGRGRGRDRRLRGRRYRQRHGPRRIGYWRPCWMGSVLWWVEEVRQEQQPPVPKLAPVFLPGQVRFRPRPLLALRHPVPHVQRRPLDRARSWYGPWLKVNSLGSHRLPIRTIC